MITGGSRGIGREIAAEFFASGAEVHVTGTSQSRPRSVPDDINYHYLDFLSDNSLNRFTKTVAEVNNFDVLVNNAGINIIESVNTINIANFRDVAEVNLIGPFILTKSITNNMPCNGKVVNMGTIWGTKTRRGRLSYSASKTGLLGLTRSFSVELAPRNILVNCVSPGFVDTELTRESLTTSELEDLKKQVPLGRLASTTEIAKVVLFLCSELNSFITGQNIVVDGGFTNV